LNFEFATNLERQCKTSRATAISPSPPLNGGEGRGEEAALPIEPESCNRLSSFGFFLRKLGLEPRAKISRTCRRISSQILHRHSQVLCPRRGNCRRRPSRRMSQRHGFQMQRRSRHERVLRAIRFEVMISLEPREQQMPTAVDFVPDHRVTEVAQVNAHLKGVIKGVTLKASNHNFSH